MDLFRYVNDDKHTRRHSQWTTCASNWAGVSQARPRVLTASREGAQGLCHTALPNPPWHLLGILQDCYSTHPLESIHYNTSTQKTPPVRTESLLASCTHFHSHEMPWKADTWHHPPVCWTTSVPVSVCLPRQKDAVALRMLWHASFTPSYSTLNQPATPPESCSSISVWLSTPSSDIRAQYFKRDWQDYPGRIGLNLDLIWKLGISTQIQIILILKIRILLW